MKKLLIVAVTAAALSFGGQANAEEASPAKAPTAPDVVTLDETDALIANRGPIRNLLRGLLELERRKNAWLRRTFLNRV